MTGRVGRPGGPSEAGHALMELVVALPLLAVGGAGAAGMVWTGSALLTTAEGRLAAAVEASAVADSLRLEAPAAGASGSVPLPGGTMSWEWRDGQELVVRLPATQGSEEGPEWVLSPRGEGSP